MKRNKLSPYVMTIASLICHPAWGGEFYFTLDEPGPTSGGGRYPTEDAACQVAYAFEAAKPVTNPNMILQPYSPPFFRSDIPPNLKLYACDVQWKSKDGGAFYNQLHFIYRNGDDCTDSESFNPVTGKCESDQAEQDRKELGDPTHPASVGFVACGDPVNPANGNVYESEVDFALVDGSLRFERSYNSRAPYGGWSSTFDTSLTVDRELPSRGAVVKFADGRSAFFPSSNGILRPDGGEFGSLKKTTGGWIYSSTMDERLFFNDSGELTRWEKPGGRFVDITTVSRPPLEQVKTVVDELGHSYALTIRLGLPARLVAGDLIVDYTYDQQRRLSMVTKAWSDHKSSRTYLYEDSRFPTSLTGIIDERGVRISTWTYDANGRATSAAMASGVGKFSFAYDSPTQTTVTNPLGHPVKYGFAVVQGAKRIIAIDGEPTAGCPASNSKFTYTADAQLATQTNALGHVTAYTYDTLGRQTKQVEGQGTADERTTSTTWDGTSFRPATVTTADRVTSYTYDAQGRPLSTTTRSLKD
ncbi:hypothetical protein KCV01_g7450, partial [Aureobasidium melanogenum]